MVTMILGAIVIIGGAIVLGSLLYGISIYNALVAIRKEVDRAWANIDVLLKQRHDELPKIISTVESYMQYEQDTLKGIIAARNIFGSAHSIAEKNQANQQMQAAIGQFFALAENYPELKASAQFQELQRRISQLEGELSDRREYYNASVNTFNTRIEQIPDLFVARLLNYKGFPMFQITEAERKDVEVKIRQPNAQAR